MMTLMMPLGGGGPSKWWCADTLKVRGGRLETLSKYCCRILEIMNKLMNFFMNHSLIFLNTAPTPQNIILMIVEKHILIIGTCRKSHQATHLLLTYYTIILGGGGGSRTMMMLMTQGVQNGPKVDGVILLKKSPPEWKQGTVYVRVGRYARENGTFKTS